MLTWNIRKNHELGSGKFLNGSGILSEDFMGPLTAQLFRLVRCVVVIAVSLSVYPTTGSSAPSCSDLPVGIEIEANWWSILPYASKSVNSQSKSNDMKIEGIFPELFQKFENETGIKIKYSEPFSTHSNFTKTANLKNQTIFFPIMARDNDDDECFIPVMQTNGPAYFVHYKEIVPLNLLGRGLLQGWQVIALTILLAAISGIVMWLMDRKANPEDFPAAFFPGIWQGFWWAFVTMTTVGYGDTAPRSIPARLYSILWMIIGMIAFSVLTANITSSLSHQTFDAEEKLFGKKVGVLDGTMDAEAALMENANVNSFNSVKELLSNMKAGNVDGILIERYVAGAYYNKFNEEGLQLGTMLMFPYYFGMRAPSYIPGHNLQNGSPCKVLKKCVQDILKKDNVATQILIDLSKGWRSFEKSSSTSLFEDQSFFYILIAFFFALCGVGGLWHYFYFLPIQREEQQQADNVEAGGTGSEDQEKIFLLKKEIEPLCLECRDKIEQVLQEHPDRNFHESSFPFQIPIATPNLKRMSSNAFGQLRNLQNNTVGQIPGFIGQRKRGRVV